MIEAGAMAIYAEFIRAPDPETAVRRWSRTAELTKTNYRNEARACIRAAMEASRHG